MLLAMPARTEVMKILIVCSMEFFRENNLGGWNAHDDFEIAETFLDLSAHAANFLQAFSILPLDPGAEYLSDDQ